MRVTLGYVLDVDDHADAQDLCAAVEELFTDGGITVVSSNTAVDEKPYTVVGLVRGKPDTRWKEQVHAADSEAAEAEAIRRGEAEKQNRAVADVVEGHR